MENRKILSIAIAAAFIAVMFVAVVPITTDAGECPGTGTGGVPGNRQSTSPLGSASSVVGLGIVTGPFDLADTYVHFTRTDNADDWSGGSAADEPFLMNQAPDGFSSANMGTWMDSFAYNDKITCVVDRWDGSAGYTTSKTQPVPSGGGDFGTLTIEPLPQPTVAGGVVTWTGMSDASVIGYMVYESNTGNLGADGWGSGDWSSVFADPVFAINASAQGVPEAPQVFNAAVDTVNGYVAANGGAVHQLTDSSPSTYYAITAVYHGYGLAAFAGFEWNFESLFHGAMNVVSGSAIPDITLRDTTGIYVMQMPADLMGLTDAMSLADFIEAETDLLVTYISDYDGFWSDYLHRSNIGATLKIGTNFALDTTESYVISVMHNTTASDPVILEDDHNWEEASSANTVVLSAGWNNVGVFYDSAGNYDNPQTELTANPLIDNAAAWIGDGWTSYSDVAWDSSLHQQAGTVDDLFNAGGNMHGFFVRSPAGGSWNQAS